MPLTVGQILLRNIFPEDIDLEGRSFDKQGIKGLLTEVADKHPEKYRDVLADLLTLGKSVSFDQGVSISLKGLLPSKAKQRIIADLRRDLEQIERLPDGAGKDQRVVAAVRKRIEPLQQALMEEGKAENNPYVQQIVAGSRGKPAQYTSLRGSDLLYEDHNGEPVPIPVLNSYADGLDPVEYFAGTFGARRGLADVKFSTADAGFFGKRLVNASHRQVVTDDAPVASRLPVGLPTDASDSDNVGAVLAQDVGEFAAGTQITPQVLRAIRQQAGPTKRFLVHSPITSRTEGGGLDRLSAGVREKRQLAPIGDNIGIPAAQAVAERVSQGMLNCLAEGTLVRMADFSTRRIEDILPGEQVLGADKSGHTFPVTVTRLFDQGTQPVQRYTFRDGQSRKYTLQILATTEHKILCNLKRYGQADEAKNHELQVLPIGHPASRYFYAVKGTGFTAEGLTDHYRCVRVAAIDVGQRHCWDIEVDHPDHLFVLANGLIVSNSKHSGGTSGAQKLEQSGFKYIDRLVEAPKVFSQAGIMAPIDGRVRGVEEAPQGGTYIFVDDEKIYVPPDRKVTVKNGQELEAGDMLSDGVPHPALLVKYKGIGEARRQFTRTFMDGLRNSGIPIHRRNAELLASGIINHVQVTDPNGIGDYVVDDVVPYSAVFNASYTPRKGTQRMPVNRARGKYLEEPALHYTPGTRITKAVAKDLDEFGVADVDVNDVEPAYEPHMVRAMQNLFYDEDWQTQLSGFYTGKAFQRSVQRGAKSTPESTSYVPSLAKGTDFGKTLEETGTF